MFPLCSNRSIDLLRKSVGWFLYDKKLVLMDKDMSIETESQMNEFTLVVLVLSYKMHCTKNEVFH